MAFLEPKTVLIKVQSGGEKEFVISKFPAIAGREIIAKYPVSNTPKVGDYNTSKETMLKLMCFVGVKLEGGEVLPLTTEALVDNHVPDWEALMKLEWAMMEYNCSFFGNGGLLNTLKSMLMKAAPSAFQTLTLLLEQSLKAEKQPTTNSKPHTRSKKRS